MSSKIELLAPAGDWEALQAAVENGADAVYLGGKLFNARQLAGNFESIELKRAIEYTHIRDVNLYLTVNTLISDNEMKQALNMIEEAYIAGIDGIIVQDLGLAGMVKNIFPDLDLHASTQMTIYNLEGVRTLEKLRFKRVVLARELTIQEIANIARNSAIEIETFVHGALCICYSGQCLMSSMIGARSGNRGKCAQPCRLPYEIVGEMSSDKEVSRKGYLLSPKDICTINELEQLIKSGVKSLKIEGRMKSPEYVATVVRTYRKYLDKAKDNASGNKKVSIEETDVRDITQIFNRGGLYSGYLNGKSGRDMMCYEKPKNWGIYLGEVISYDNYSKMVDIKLEEDLSTGDGVEIWNGEAESPGGVVSIISLDGEFVKDASINKFVRIGNISGSIFKGNKVYKTSDKKLNEIAKESYNGRSLRKVKLKGRVYIKSGTPVVFYVEDNEKNSIEVVGDKIPEAALNKPISKERVLEQVLKTGTTPFEFEKVEIELDENLALPISEINNLRRLALEGIERKRSLRYRRIMSVKATEIKDNLLHFPGNSRKTQNNIKISVLYNNISEIFEIPKVDRIYIPFGMFIDGRNGQIIENCHRAGTELYLWLPAITRGNYDALIGRQLSKTIESGIDGVLIGNTSAIEFLKFNQEIKIAGDFSLNIFNSFSAIEWKKLGLSRITLSLEMNMAQLADLKSIPELEKEVVVYGRIPMMTSEYCPVGSILGGFKKDSLCNVACAKGVYSLKDRMGKEFPVWCDKIDCRSTIFNSTVLFMLESMEKFNSSGIDSVRLNITDEKPEEIAELVEAYKDIVLNGKVALSKYDDLIQKIKNKGFTNGHYFRGV